MTILLPGIYRRAELRGALSTCAIEGNGLASDALETLRRIEAGEEVGQMYLTRFKRILGSLGYTCEVSDGNTEGE